MILNRNKTIVLRLISLLAVLFSSVQFVQSQEQADNGTIVIVVNNLPDQTRTSHSLSCYYSKGTVTIIADSNTFGIQASVTRIEDQTSWEGNSADNALIFETSSASGYYMLVITLQDGSAYCGSYNLN